jgi:hypothetical protein
LSAIIKTGSLIDGRSASFVALMVQYPRASATPVVEICGRRFTMVMKGELPGILKDKELKP